MTLQLDGVDVDLSAILNELARFRPIFHSEADFQFSFAWQIKKAIRGVEVRLETQPPDWRAKIAESGFEGHRRLDIELLAGSERLGIEVKYLKHQRPQTHKGEYFSGGGDPFDVRSFDVVNDLVRIEKYTTAVEGALGAVVVLSGRAGFWSPKRKPEATAMYDQFRISEGVVLEKRRAWGPAVSLGTRGRRPEYLDLAGRYELRWRPYSLEPVEHKVLVIEVPSQASI